MQKAHAICWALLAGIPSSRWRNLLPNVRLPLESNLLPRVWKICYGFIDVYCSWYIRRFFFCISGASTDLALTWEDLNFFSWALQPSPVVSTENHWRFRDAKSASSENPFSIAQACLACLFDICITCIIWKFVSLYRCITLKLKSTIR